MSTTRKATSRLEIPKAKRQWWWAVAFHTIDGCWGRTLAKYSEAEAKERAKYLMEVVGMQFAHPLPRSRKEAR